MKNTQNGTRRWIPFGAVKRCGICFGIAAMVTLSMAACATESPCDRYGPELARVVRVVVDEDLLFWTIQSSGDCTELVEVVGGVGYREWQTKMTGPVGSTCTIDLDIGKSIRSETTKVVDYSTCGYPGAKDITFARE